MNLQVFTENRKDSEDETIYVPNLNIQTLEQFNALMNEDPDPRNVKINKFAGNSKYVPISYVQMMLDQFFLGLWKTSEFTYQVIANEEVGKVKLEYYHPFAKTWIEREGAAAVMIQQNSGAPITDIGAKIKNTLGKDHPHLLASCVVSAARSIGKVFGRDLNRKEEDSYQTFYTDMVKAKTVTDAINWKDIKALPDLKKVWSANAELHSNKQFVKEFTYRKNQLEK
jgi:hypothetical protein